MAATACARINTLLAVRVADDAGIGVDAQQQQTRHDVRWNRRLDRRDADRPLFDRKSGEDTAYSPAGAVDCDMRIPKRIYFDSAIAAITTPRSPATRSPTHASGMRGGPTYQRPLPGNKVYAMLEHTRSGIGQIGRGIGRGRKSRCTVVGGCRRPK